MSGAEWSGGGVDTGGSGDVRYVCGFLFDGHKRVLLVQKTRGPAAIVGKWNGIGGRIEPNELQRQAMRREFREETGIDLEWAEPLLQLSGYGDSEIMLRFWCVYFFRAYLPEMPKIASRNDVGEQLGAFEVTTVLTRAHGDVQGYGGIVPNLRWILPLMLDGDVRKAMVQETPR